MIIILSGVVALGALVLLDRNGEEELGTFVFCGILGLLVLITIFYRISGNNTKITLNRIHYSKWLMGVITAHPAVKLTS